MSPVTRLKLEHLELCIDGEVEARRGTLLDEVELLHEALPELAWSEVDAPVELFGRSLQAPFGITGMPGGAPDARAVNLAHAAAAQKLGFGIGVGSQRATLPDPALAATNRVREPAIVEAGERLAEGLRAGMALTGARRVADLRGVPRTVGPRLAVGAEPLTDRRLPVSDGGMSAAPEFGTVRLRP